MRVLVVEDDPQMTRLLHVLLESEGYQVESAASRADALAAVARADPDLVLLDVVLGPDDGRDLLVDLRKVSDIPVVLVTGRGLETDRIDGLRMGADDYIVKPFSPGELAARVATVLRRCRPAGRAVPRQRLAFGQLTIDPVSREVRAADRPVELTAKEFDLLLFLASSPRQVFTRQQLLQRVWSSSSEWQGEATVTEHVRRVRRKIERDPDQPEWIRTVRGVGYRFEPDGPARPTAIALSPLARSA